MLQVGRSGIVRSKVEQATRIHETRVDESDDQFTGLQIQGEVTRDQVQGRLAGPIGIQVCRWLQQADRAGGAAEKDDFFLAAGLDQRQQRLGQQCRSQRVGPVCIQKSAVLPCAENLRASSRLDLFRRLGLELSEVEQTLSAEAADGTLADQLELPLGAPLLLISRVTRDQRGRPFDYLRALYRPDRFSYHMRLNAKDLVVRGYR